MRIEAGDPPRSTQHNDLYNRSLKDNERRRPTLCRSQVTYTIYALLVLSIDKFYECNKLVKTMTKLTRIVEEDCIH